MADYPTLPIWTDALLGDTLHLSAEEFGAYLLLLIVSWRTPTCTLPDNDDDLARYCRVSKRRWKDRLRPRLEPFFTINAQTWEQKRLLATRDFVSKNTAQKSKAGKASALKRKETASTAAAEPLQQQDQQKANTMATSKSISKSISKESKKVEGAIRAPPPPSEVANKPLEILNGEIPNLVQDAWNSFAKPLKLPCCQKMTKARAALAKARWKDAGGADGIQTALDKVRALDWMHGNNPRGWRVNLDFFLRESSFTRLMEGVYDDAREDRDWASIIAED